MSLQLFMHPLSSFCHKVLIALYENHTAFEARIIDLGNPTSRAELEAIWPITKFPVLKDAARGQTIPESTIIIEYLDQHYPGAVRFIPQDVELAREVRLYDRILDAYVHQPMQKVVNDRIRPADSKDPMGVDDAKRTMRIAYAMLDRDLAGKTWIVGGNFTLADCSAAPALFYANKVLPFGPEQKHLSAYFERLLQRPSYARTLKEAEPYFSLFPG
jgi:glutathione S-transferase